MAVLGPLENADLVGTDLTLDIHQTVLTDLEDSHAPSPYLQGLVAQAKLGMKSGAGFQRRVPDQAARLRARVVQHLQRLDAILEATAAV